MASADGMPPVPATSSTPHSHHLAAYSQGEQFQALVPFVDQYIDHDISTANVRTIDMDSFLKGLGAEDGEIGGNDEGLRGIADSQEVLDLRAKYCETVSGEVDRYGPFCNLANYIIGKLQGSSILFVRNDPKHITGVCNSTRKPDIIGLLNDHESVMEERWRAYNDKGPPLNDEVRKGKGGNKKGVKHFVPWDWKDIQYVGEFKKQSNTIRLNDPTELLPSINPAGYIDSGNPPDATSLTKRKPMGSGAVSRIGSSETRGRASPPGSMIHSSTSSSARLRGKRKMQEEAEAETSSVKRQRQGDVPAMRIDLQRGGAKYAVDQLSALTHRRHVIEFLVIDDVLTLAYYDRIGPVYSKDLNFVQDLYRFSLLIKLLATRTPLQRGFLEKLIDMTGPFIDDGSSPALPTEESKGQHRDAKALGIGSGSSTLASPSQKFEHGGHIGMDEGFEDEAEAVPPPTPPIDSQQPAEVTVHDGNEEGSGAIGVSSSKPSDRAIEPELGKHRYNLKLLGHIVHLYDLCGKRPPYGLISRGTSVFLSQCKTLDSTAPDKVYATKISWPLARRHSEAEILKEARGILRALDADPDQKEIYGYGKRKLEHCLPEIYWAEDIDDLLEKDSFRWKIKFLHDESKPVNRICRAIVMERLEPLRYVKSVDHFKQAIRDVVLAHHVLFTSKSQILHRDISVDNLMVRYNKDGTVCGVLIDFDLAAKFSEVIEDHTGTRTGTRPFMAWELLESDPAPVHLERFDWESFFYVICWIGCRYSEGKEVNNSILSDWHSANDAILVLIKQRWLFGPDAPQSFTPFYGTLLRDWRRPLQRMFYSGREARDDTDLNEEFDEVTLGGHVTWERFWEILQK